MIAVPSTMRGSQAAWVGGCAQPFDQVGGDRACPQERAGVERATDHLREQRSLDKRAAKATVGFWNQQAQRAEIGQAGPQGRVMAHARLQLAHVIERAALVEQACEGRFEQLLLFVQTNVHHGLLLPSIPDGTFHGVGSFSPRRSEKNLDRTYASTRFLAFGMCFFRSVRRKKHMPKRKSTMLPQASDR